MYTCTVSIQTRQGNWDVTTNKGSPPYGIDVYHLDIECSRKLKE